MVTQYNGIVRVGGVTLGSGYRGRAFVLLKLVQ